MDPPLWGVRYSRTMSSKNNSSLGPEPTDKYHRSCLEVERVKYNARRKENESSEDTKSS